jgi:hypothetical protein
MALLTKRDRRRFTNESYGFNADQISTRPLESRAPVSFHQRMIMLLIMALVSMLFLLAIQPTMNVSALPLLELKPALAPSDSGIEPVEAALGDTSMNAIPDDGISPVFTDEIRYWQTDIVRWANEYDLDPNLIAIIMQVESCGDPQAESFAGAKGLFQVMPFHFTADENALDPDTNARRGISYFLGRLEQTGGDIGRSYAGYNGGHVAAAGSWDDWYPETQSYYIWTTGIYEDIQSGSTDSPTLNQWLQAGGAGLCQQAADRLGI